jgi:hypothetical protein
MAGSSPAMTDIHIEPISSTPRQREPIAAREGVFMQKWFGAAAMMLAASPAFAADVAVCTLSADKTTVTVTASNPYAQVMACEVNCNMEIPHGNATVVCVKPVPVGSKDFVMCTRVSRDGGTYTRVKDAEVNCPDPAAPPAASESETKANDSDDDDDDAKSDARTDAMMKKMLKQGQDFLDRQKQN